MLFSLEIIDYIFKKTVCDGDGIVRLWINYVFGQNLKTFIVFLYSKYIFTFTADKSGC